MTAVFRSHRGRGARGSEFAAHVAADKHRVMSAHSTAIRYKKQKTTKQKKVVVKKMNMTKYKAATTKQVLAAIKAGQGT